MDPSKIADVLTLAKIRVNSLVVATTAGGFYMATSTGMDAFALINACVGTALVAGGAAALNQVSERDVDLLMERTRNRPIPAGRMAAAEGLTLAVGMAAVGATMLWIVSGPLAAGVALATLVLYAWVYTPLKRITSLSTIVGAVPGAMPPLIGWAAAAGSLADPAPWALFLIGFFWQLPHILAVGWMYRDDYARSGFPMLPVVDTTGAATGRQAMLWAAALIPISLLPSTPAVHLTGLVYVVGALVVGVLQFVMAVQFARERSREKAKRLFYATLLYLPALWILMATTKR